MKLDWEYFKLEEFTRSQTASELGFFNTPLESDIQNLDLLVSNILDPLRKAWGKPIIVTSGYRVPRLNEAVGGVKNSDHLYGRAADIVPQDPKDFKKFTEFIKDFLKDKEFKQCIIEKSKYSKWIHISYDTLNNRKQLFYLNK
jgi:hypothetical protein